jgi:hypothetical protein
MWNNFKDEHGKNILNIGRLMYVSKHGKQAISPVGHVPPRDDKSALSLVVHLFLEHSKVTKDDSIIQDWLMKVIKNSSKDEAIHSNSSSKVNTTFACFVVDFLSMLLLFDACIDHNANAAPAPWASRFLSTIKEDRHDDKSKC